MQMSHQGGSPPPSYAARQSPRKSQAMEDEVLLTRTPDEETPDGRIRNREAIQKIRDAWIYKQVRNRQKEFTQYRTARCFVGTWNVNAKGKEESLDEWLRTREWGQTPPDIIVAGFQEIVDLNAVNVAVDNKTQQRSQFWIERLRTTLPHNCYTLLAQKSMVGLLICVFVRNDHHGRVQYVQTASVGVGVLGMGGNKGGVSIRLQFYDSCLCFVCSHLAAHRENVVGRNQDAHNILAKTNFEIGEDAIRNAVRSGSLSHWTMGSSTVKIADHDAIVWLGDLNYRIDDSMSTEQVLHAAENNRLQELRVLDQLNVERAAGRVLEDFIEGPLNFPPTYKYQPGTDVYEQRPDKKLRAPAWCDRILYSSVIENTIQQLSYGRSERPNCSDHKPVYSMLQMTIKDVIPAKREAIYEELMKVLDQYENQTLPVVGLDRVALDFGPIKYEEQLSLPIQITNVGSVAAQWRLVPKPDEVSTLFWPQNNAVCKPWLTVTPKFGMIIPGEKPTTMEFSLMISKETAQMLNSGRESLDDILILRLEGGRDYYITVKGSFARSCFGMTLDELVLYAEPIRSVPLDPIEQAKIKPKPAATALCVPKELWRTIDAIFEKGLHAPHLFVESGIPNEIRSVRESLDTGAPFQGQFSIHSYAEVLITFLSSLAVPVVTQGMIPANEIDSQTIQISARRLLEELPPIHYNVFVYVISFFREVLAFRERNQLTAAKVARICCRAFCGDAFDESGEGKRTGMQLVILHLLETTSI